MSWRTSQVSMSMGAVWTWRMMSAETIKMPLPTMDPATIIVDENRPSSRR